MDEPDALAQWLDNERAEIVTVSSYVTPIGIITVTVEFEPYEAD